MKKRPRGHTEPGALTRAGETAPDWHALADKRVFDLSVPAEKALIAAADLEKQSMMREIRIDLRGCRTFEDVARRFQGPLALPDWFGANADALHDVLGRLDSGRYLFRIGGTERLDRMLRNRLKYVLSLKTEGGSGYGEGEPVFLVE